MLSQYKHRTIFVKQNSTLPEVKFPISKRTMEKYDITDGMMENVAITFSMRDADTGVYQIANVEGRLRSFDNEDYEQLDEAKYVLTYRFKLNQTARSGRFLGEFKLDFLGDSCGKISFPTDHEINIVIQDSLTKTTVL
jgi:hypothetical protein